MKKRLISLILCITMLAGMIPSGVFAEGESEPDSPTVAEMMESAGAEGPTPTEKPAPTEKPTEKPAAEEPVTEKPAAEESATEKPAAEIPATAEKPAADESGTEKPEAGEPAADQPATNESAEGETAADEAANEEPAEEEPTSGTPEENTPAADGSETEETETEKPEADSPAAEEERFSRGLARIKTDEVIYKDAGFHKKLAVTREEGVLYVESRTLTDEPAKDPMYVVFLSGGQEYRGYVPAGKLTALDDAEQQRYQAGLTEFEMIDGVRLGSLDTAPAGASGQDETPAEDDPAEGENTGDDGTPAEGVESDEDETPAEDVESDEDEAPAEDGESDEDEAPAEGDESGEGDTPEGDEIIPEDENPAEDEIPEELPEGVMSDGYWLYRVEKGFAVVVGYLDTEAVSLSIPRLLGGVYVNAIEDGAFADLCDLKDVRVHGNVIAIHGNPFPSSRVTLSGYNGTPVAAWARGHGFSFVNLTNHPNFTFQEHVIDYTYADTAHFRFTNGSTLKMHVAEAAQLSVGSMFYTPVRNGEMQAVYAVTGIRLEGEWAVLSLRKASQEESLTRYTIDEALYVDWSRTQWAEGVTVLEEKGIKFDLQDSISTGVQFKTKIPKINVDFKVDGSIGLSGHAALDWSLIGGLKELEVTVNPSMDLTFTFEKKSAHKLNESSQGLFDVIDKEGQSFDFFLGKMYLFTASGVASIVAETYFRFDLSGGIKLVLKGEGDIGIRFNPVTEKIEGVREFAWKKPSVSLYGKVEIGPVEKLSVEFAVVGKPFSIEFFIGAVGVGKVNLAKPLCVDLELSAKISLEVVYEWKWLRDLLKCSGKVTLFTYEHKVVSGHLEFIKGYPDLVDKCSLDDTFVIKFYTGLSGVTVPNQGVKYQEHITEPTITNANGKLIGWYTGRDLSTKWNFATDTVTEDMKLFAKWDLPTHTVTFVLDGSGENPVGTRGTNSSSGNYTEEVYDGELVTMPSTIKRKDYRLVGWYKDAAFTTQWNFSSDRVTSDVSIYAKWESDPGYDPFSDEESGGSDVITSETYRGYTIRYCAATGHKYVHIMEDKTYSAALADAKNAGGYLATINSAAEQAFLANYLYSDCMQNYLWLGMVSQDSWEYWATGEKVVYTNWNSAPQTTSTQYNAVIVRATGKWKTLSNTEQAHYVIEIGEPDRDPGYGANKTDFQYTIDKNSGTAIITGWLNTEATTLKAESQYQGYPVVSIAANALKNNTVVQHVVLPNTITSIGDSAFEGCSSLQDITLPDMVSTMGQRAFYGCTNLQQAVWSRGLTRIPDNTFYNCAKLKQVKNLEAVLQIGSYAFYGCKLLQNAIPPRVTAINTNAYYNNKAMNAIQLPETVTSIGSYAFSGCSGATVITLPSGLTSIPSYAFSQCSGAQTVNLPERIQSIGTGAFNGVNGTFRVYANSFAAEWCGKNGKITDSLNGKYRVIYIVDVNGEITEATIDENEAYISYGSRLTEPVISADGKTIAGWYLDPEFKQLWSFTNDKMPDHSITLYAKWVDAGSLFEFDVSQGNAVITGYNGHALAVVIPETISGYPVGSLAAGSIVSDEIRTLVIPGSVKTITSGAIRCPNLYTVTYTGSGYFSVHEDGVLYSKGGTRIVYAPEGRGFQEYTVPDGVKSISAYAFTGRNNLLHFIVPDSVTSISDNALYGNHLTTIYGSTDPSCAAAVFAGKFGFNYNIYDIFYYNGDEMIASANAQAGGLIKWHEEPSDGVLVYGGWYKDPNLTRIWDFETDIMPQSNLNLYLKMNTLFSYTVNSGNVTITGYHGDLNSVEIPEKIDGRTVTRIAKNAFTAAVLTSVTIPSTVTEIEPGSIRSGVRVIADRNTEAQAYAGREGLPFSSRKYVISFESMGGSMVADMKVIGNYIVTLPEPIRTNYYFMGWYTDTTYDSSVKWTEDTRMPYHDVTLYAYWKVINSNLTNDFTYALLEDGTIEITGYSGTKVVLSVPASINGYQVTRIGDHAFEGNTTVVSITLPDAVTSIGYSAFADSAVKYCRGAKNLTVIEDSAFANAGSLSAIDLNNKLYSIGDRAFEGCTALTDITLPKGLILIGERAFHGCTWLYSVDYFPGTVVELGRDAFTECPNLAEVTIPQNLKNAAELAFDSTTNVLYKKSYSISVISTEVTGKTQVKLGWNPVVNASSYKVWYRRAGSGSYTLADETTNRTCTLTLSADNITYLFYVSALDSAGEPLCQSEPVEVYLSLMDTPAVKSVVQSGRNSAVMTLVTVNGAEGYELERSDEAAGPFTFLKDIPVSGKCKNTGLRTGHDFYYRVRAFVTENGRRIYSRYSDVFRFHMPDRYLTAPEHLTVRQSTLTAVELIWEPVDGAAGYVIYRSINGGSFSAITSTDETQYTNTSRKAGKVYAYKVTAYFMDQGERIESAASAPAEVTILTLPTPKLISLTSTKTGALTLSWSEVAEASGYLVYRSVDGGAPVRTRNLGATTLSCNDSSVETGRVYTYQVCAYARDEEGVLSYSDYSPALSMEMPALAQVVNVKASQTGADTGKVTWTALADINRYEVWVSANNENVYELAATVDTNSAVLEGLKDGITYYVKVRAVSGENGTVYGKYSDSVSLSVLGAPVLEVVEQEGKTTIRLIWSSVPSADGYEIWRKATGDSEYSLLRALTAETATNSSLTVNNIYSYKVRAYRKVNGVKVYGAYSGYKRIRMLEIPAIQTIEPVSNTKARITWSPVKYAKGYDVYMCTVSDGVYQKVKTTAECSVDQSSLEIGKTYYFKVVPYSEIDGQTFQGRFSPVKARVVLDKPAISGVEKTGDGQITVSWGEIPGATYYLVYSGTSATSMKTETKVTAPKAVFKNLTAGKRYYYKVVACTSITSLTSRSLESTVKDIYLSALTRPAIKAFEQSSGTAVTVSWEKVSGAKGYELYRSDAADGAYTLVKRLADLSCSNSGLTSGRTYFYKIRAYKEFSTGERFYSQFSVVRSATIVSTITSVSAEITSSTGITLNWTAYPGAAGYNIYRAENGGAYTLVKYATGLTWYNSGLTVNTKYTYRIAPVMKPSGTVTLTGPRSAAVTVMYGGLAPGQITQCIQPDANTVLLRWKNIADAERYEIWRAEGTNGDFALVRTSTELQTSFSTLNSGTTYRFKVRPVRMKDGARYYGKFSSEKQITLLGAPVLTLVEKENHAVTVSWSAVNGATEYQIWRRAGSGDYERIKTITDGSLSFDNKNVTVGTAYQYKVRAVRKTGQTDETWSEIVKIKPISWTAGNYPESAHNYSNGLDQTWTYSIPGASALALVFSGSTMFDSYDKLYISGADGVQIAGSPFTGSSLKGRTVIVPGSQVTLRLTTNSYGSYYGFSFDAILPAGQ